MKNFLLALYKYKLNLYILARHFYYSTKTNKISVKRERESSCAVFKNFRKENGLICIFKHTMKYFQESF